MTYHNILEVVTIYGWPQCDLDLELSIRDTVPTDVDGDIPNHSVIKLYVTQSYKRWVVIIW